MAMTESEECAYIVGGNAASVIAADRALRHVMRKDGNYTKAQGLAILQALILVSHVACGDKDADIVKSLNNPPKADPVD